MEQLYRDFTVCKRCGGRCYLGNDYCEDCANEMWQKLKSYLINTINEKDKSLKYYKFREVLDKMQELEKEMIKSELS